MNVNKISFDEVIKITWNLCIKYKQKNLIIKNDIDDVIKSNDVYSLDFIEDNKILKNQLSFGISHYHVLKHLIFFIIELFYEINDTNIPNLKYTKRNIFKCELDIYSDLVKTCFDATKIIDTKDKKTNNNYDCCYLHALSIYHILDYIKSPLKNCAYNNLLIIENINKQLKN